MQSAAALLTNPALAGKGYPVFRWIAWVAAV